MNEPKIGDIYFYKALPVYGYGRVRKVNPDGTCYFTWNYGTPEENDYEPSYGPGSLNNGSIVLVRKNKITVFI